MLEKLSFNFRFLSLKHDLTVLSHGIAFYSLVFVITILSRNSCFAMWVVEFEKNYVTEKCSIRIFARYTIAP